MKKGYRESEIVRFFRHCRPMRLLDCWDWQGSWDRATGYGCFGKGGGAGLKEGAHRAAYRLIIGPIPYGQLVCHSCDNRKCINPNHLFLGTHKDNTRDMVEKGRNYKPPLKATTEEILALRSLGLLPSVIAMRLGVSRATVACRLYKFGAI